MLRRLIPLALLALAAPALAGQPLQQQIEESLAKAPPGTRFGLLVVDEQGDEVVAVNPDQRFIPASNTKMFTTAAAMEVMARGDAEAHAGITTLSLVRRGGKAPDVQLTGAGVNLSTAADCKQRCLSQLVDPIAAHARKVGNVIADDTLFADQRWSPGMSWNNIQTDSGTATSALIVDDNELPLVVTAGAVGAPPLVSLSPYFTLRNQAITVAEGETRLAYERAPNSREVRLYGTIRADAGPWRELMGIDDPADFAGWSVRQALEARGVKVQGKVIVRHRPAAFADRADPSAQPRDMIFAAGVMTPPLGEEAAIINKPSQNLHAEVLLRRLGIAAVEHEIFAEDHAQPGSLEAGLAAERAVLEKAGIPRAGYDFSDGSGMSTYNRVSPRAGVALLRWAKGQPWGDAWRASLPVGGVDGTLRRRFRGTPLEGKIWAKTGTLNATNALSGYFQAASGREFTFSFFANDVPDGTSALATMETALVLIAAQN
jgi:D-alanyl-D-alanine carboxypeptidase/D-alanyl-D-alanine-endopeptidase (penicillin-binding protein 4)